MIEKTLLIDQPSTDTQAPVQKDIAQVLSWRLSQLLDAGYGEASAVLIACANVDLHQAIDLRQRGCPVPTALRILL